MASVFAEARTTDVRAAWVGRATDFYTYARVHAGLVSTLPHFNPPIVIIIQWFVVSAPERVHPSASRNGTPPRVPHVSHDASTRTPNESKFSFFLIRACPSITSPGTTRRHGRVGAFDASSSRAALAGGVHEVTSRCASSRRASRVARRARNKNKKQKQNVPWRKPWRRTPGRRRRERRWQKR